MIASVEFRNFKALREARVDLCPFNLIVGPNGSGKTSLIQALLRLRTLARLDGAAAVAGAASISGARPPVPVNAGRAVLEFGFGPPHEGIRARLSCVEQLVCDRIEFLAARGEGAAAVQARAALRREIAGVRAYLFDHYAMSEPSVLEGADGAAGKGMVGASGAAGASAELAGNGGNLAVVLDGLRAACPENFAQLEAELRQIVPEFSAVETRLSRVETAGGEGSIGGGGRVQVELGLRLRGQGGELVTADNLSQGTLYLLAILYLVFQPEPPSVVCIEEIDRGMHPRWLRPLRDLLYRLSYPSDFGEARAPVQVLATTHSPYLLDLFKDHPEEVIISQKHGQRAHFERLSDRRDLGSLLGEASLGDLWFSGILGGVPEEEGFW